MLVVQNERNQTVSSQKINEKLPFKLTTENSMKITTPDKTSVIKERNKTCHVLQPITVGDFYY